MIRSLLLLLITLLTPLQAQGRETPFDQNLAIKSPQTLEKVTLQLSWKYQFQFAGFIAALEKGYYKDAGFDVTIKEYDLNTDIVEDVLNNKAQFSVSSSSITQHKLNGKPIVLLANYFKRSALVLLTKPTILVPKDLKNKRIMISDWELSNGTLAQFFKAQHLKKQDFTSVPHTFNTHLFETGQVDAMTAYLSNQPYFLKKSGTPYNVIDPTNYGAPSLEVNLFTSFEYANKDPVKIQAFIDASNKGWAYALAHKDEIIQILATRYPSNKSVAALKYEAEITEKLMLTQTTKIGSVNQKQFIQNNQHLPNYSAEKLNHYFFDNIYSSQSILTLTQQRYLAKKKTITLCVDPDWLPYEKINKGKHTGMSADYFAFFEKSLTVPITLIPTKNWTESLNKVKARECDILSLAAKTPKRSQFLNFTPPYLSTPLVLATTMDKPFTSQFSNVADKPIGIGKDYVYTEILNDKFPVNSLIETNNLATGLDRVVSGEYYGYLDALATIGYKFQRDYNGQLKISAKFDEKFELSVAVRNDDPMLLSIFTKLVNSIPEQLHSEIANRWISVTINKETDYQLVWKILIGASILLTFGLMLFLQQRKNITRLQKAHVEIHKVNTLLKKQSITDTLTGAHNRLQLDKTLQKQLNRFQDEYQIFSIILLDIDNFKAVNDTYGHIAGDKALIDLAKVLQSMLRSQDSLGRWGGEEFLIICPGTNEKDALALANAATQAVSLFTFSHKQPMTISSGVVSVQPKCTAESLTHHADEALYHAKKTGKNKAVSYSQLSQENPLSATRKPPA